jgi:hypothetical protein
LIIFNDSVPVEIPALQAVLMVRDMQSAIEAPIQKWRSLGHGIGFGIVLGRENSTSWRNRSGGTQHHERMSAYDTKRTFRR